MAARTSPVPVTETDGPPCYRVDRTKPFTQKLLNYRKGRSLTKHSFRNLEGSNFRKEWRRFSTITRYDLRKEWRRFSTITRYDLRKEMGAKGRYMGGRHGDKRQRSHNANEQANQTKVLMHQLIYMPSGNGDGHQSKAPVMPTQLEQRTIVHNANTNITRRDQQTRYTLPGLYLPTHFFGRNR